jgi:hypothetical protein
MSFTPNNFLTSDPDIYLKDRQHAARLFNDDQFRLAPKHKFSFHVAFNINPAACKDSSLFQRHRNEINMLVKSVSLPSFAITTELVNQYNRKKAVQVQHKPGDIDIVFHDDNMGLINKLWQNYYSYYYADSNSAQSSSAYARNATKNSNFISSNYGLDNGSSTPFFNYITIYQMARHEYVSYKLINPIITSWNHNKLDYSDTKSNDFSMKLLCESVAYGSGNVDENSPEGFGVEHYDSSPSPLSSMPQESYSPSFAKDVIADNTSTILTSVIEQVNNNENNKLTSNSVSAATKMIPQNQNSQSGIQGFYFPISKPETSMVQANSTNIR